MRHGSARALELIAMVVRSSSTALNSISQTRWQFFMAFVSDAVVSRRFLANGFSSTCLATVDSSGHFQRRNVMFSTRKSCMQEKINMQELEVSVRFFSNFLFIWLIFMRINLIFPRTLSIHRAYVNGTENQAASQVVQKRKTEISNSKAKRNHYEFEDFERE